MFKIKFIVVTICSCLLYGSTITVNTAEDTKVPDQTSTHVYKDTMSHPTFGATCPRELTAAENTELQGTTVHLTGEVIANRLHKPVLDEFSDIHTQFVCIADNQTDIESFDILDNS